MPGEQRAYPRRRRSIDPQLVPQRVPVRAESRTGHAGQEQERARLRRRVPAPDFVDRRRIPHQDGVQPLPEQALGQLGVASRRSHEVGQRSQHGVAAGAGLEQRLGCRRQPHTPAVQLGERVAAPRELRQGLLRLAPRRPRAGLS